jgi:hypothetical protein
VRLVGECLGGRCMHRIGRARIEQLPDMKTQNLEAQWTAQRRGDVELRLAHQFDFLESDVLEPLQGRLRMPLHRVAHRIRIDSDRRAPRWQSLDRSAEDAPKGRGTAEGDQAAPGKRGAKITAVTHYIFLIPIIGGRVKREVVNDTRHARS